jgi:hypothetical protein
MMNSNIKNPIVFLATRKIEKSDEKNHKTTKGGKNHSLLSFLAEI